MNRITLVDLRDDHPIMSLYENMYQKSVATDFSINATLIDTTANNLSETPELKVHKVLLISSSEFFAKMFSNNWMEGQLNQCLLTRIFKS